MFWLISTCSFLFFHAMNVPACRAASECSFPVDIILESCDGERFGAHSTHLELYSDSFPNVRNGHITIGPSEVVKLEEVADVVLLMLQFMHNQVHPDCEQLDLGLLLAFAEAADKYGMYPAFEACKKGIRSKSADFPLEVLLFESRYGLGNVEEAARKILDIPVDDVMAAFRNAPDVFIIWTQ